MSRSSDRHVWPEMGDSINRSLDRDQDRSYPVPERKPETVIPYLEWFDMSMETLNKTEIGDQNEVEVRAILHYGYGREVCICRFAYAGIPFIEYRYFVDCQELYCDDLPDRIFDPEGERVPMEGYPTRAHFNSINEFVTFCMNEYRTVHQPEGVTS